MIIFKTCVFDCVTIKDTNLYFRFTQSKHYFRTLPWEALLHLVSTAHWLISASLLSLRRHPWVDWPPAQFPAGPAKQKSDDPTLFHLGIHPSLFLIQLGLPPDNDHDVSWRLLRLVWQLVISYVTNETARCTELGETHS